MRYRDGLLIALGVVTGLRRKNLAEIEIGQHLRLEPEQVRLVFDTIKNGEVFDTAVPAFLLPYLRRYLAHHRPLLLQGRPDCAALWINLDGRPLAYEALYGIFRRHGIRLLGQRISPHALRHALATTLLREDPNNVKLAASALAHRGVGTVNRFYDCTGGTTAGDRWQRAIRHRRGDRSS